MRETVINVTPSEEIQHELQGHYEHWLLAAKASHYPLPFVIRVLRILLLHPVAMTLRLCWNLIGQVVLIALTRSFVYPLLLSKGEEGKNTLKCDMCAVEILLKHSWLIATGLFMDWIVSIRTLFSPLTYNSWKSLIAGSTFAEQICIHSKFMTELADEASRNVASAEEVEMCLKGTKTLMRHALKNVWSPTLTIINGEVHILSDVH